MIIKKVEIDEIKNDQLYFSVTYQKLFFFRKREHTIKCSTEIFNLSNSLSPLPIIIDNKFQGLFLDSIIGYKKEQFVMLMLKNLYKEMRSKNDI